MSLYLEEDTKAKCTLRQSKISGCKKIRLDMFTNEKEIILIPRPNVLPDVSS